VALVVLALVRSSSFPDDVVEDRRVFGQAIIKKSPLPPPAPYLAVAYFRTSQLEFSIDGMEAAADALRLARVYFPKSSGAQQKNWLAGNISLGVC
jgi:hypothetical protein